MVEKFIYDYSGEFTKKQIWDRLTKKMMYQTYCVIIDYLIYAGRIAIDKEGKIAWIWDPEGVENYLKKKHLLWRK